jgi:hypothetical protein
VLLVAGDLRQVEGAAAVASRDLSAVQVAAMVRFAVERHRGADATRRDPLFMA